MAFIDRVLGLWWDLLPCSTCLKRGQAMTVEQGSVFRLLEHSLCPARDSCSQRCLGQMSCGELFSKRAGEIVTRNATQSSAIHCSRQWKADLTTAIRETLVSTAGNATHFSPVPPVLPGLHLADRAQRVA